jgi:hypothetical protein
VDVTNVKSDDIHQGMKKQKGLRIQFAEYHTEIYPDGEEDTLQEEVVAEYEVQALMTKKKTSFLGKFFKPKNKKQDSALQPKASQESITLEPPINPSTAPEQTLVPDIAPINVLRIFPGNITLNTTFKSVSFDKETTIDVLIKHSLKKFRVANTEVEQYYMTVTPVDEFGISIQQGRIILKQNEDYFQMKISTMSWTRMESIPF